MTRSSTAPGRARAAQTGSFPRALTIARLRGVPIRVDPSWLVIAALVSWIVYGRFSQVLSARPPALVTGAAVAVALLLFASILAHELGHMITSLDRDVPVAAVTLFAMGGVTESTREARSARDEFVIVGIGPLISLVLGAAFALVTSWLIPSSVPSMVTGYLAWTNVALAVFNVLPGYPLDGGRLLRSLLWMGTGQPHKATRWAARVGQVFAALVIFVGVRYMLTQGGGALGGLWEVLIGLFLLRGATESHRHASVRERAGRRRVTDVMGSVPPPLRPDTPLDQALQAVQERPSLLWPVGDPVTGGLLLHQIDAVPSDRWPDTVVADLAAAAADVCVDVDTPLDDALERMATSPGHMLLVVREGRAVGLLTPSLATPLPG
jgi:Zn-dependent protease/CBS domain-containing protein